MLKEKDIQPRAQVADITEAMFDDKENINAREVIHKGMNAEEYFWFLNANGLFEDMENFKFVVDFCEVIKKQGGRALMVGGSVRDEIMKKPIKDYDLEVYGLDPELLREIISDFGHTKETGSAFAVIKLKAPHGEVDVSLPRRESKTGKGHKDFAISADPSMSIKEAASRRDFTMNSMAKDPLTGEIFDYFSGMEDLQNGILKVTDSEKFVEDPLRVLRAVQFIGRMDLMLEDESANLIRKIRPELKYLSKERFTAEWEKLLLRSRQPSLALRSAMELGIFHEMHPEVVALARTPQEADWHPEGDVWTHTLMAVDKAANIIKENGVTGDDAFIIMLATFCHDFGKPATIKFENGRVRALGHEEAGVEPTGKFLTEIGVENLKIRKTVFKLVAEHLRPISLYNSEIRHNQKVSDGAIEKLAKDLAPATIEQLVMVSRADKLGRGPFVDKNDPEKSFMPKEYPAGDWLLERARNLRVSSKEKPKPVLMGRDLIQLGHKPSSDFGLLINAVDNLRTRKNISREEVLEIVREHKEKSLAEIADIFNKV